MVEFQKSLFQIFVISVIIYPCRTLHSDEMKIDKSLWDIYIMALPT
jgi:type III secretory pathway component EscU